ncbi:MAG: hypothetical protein AAGL89_01095 [Pseudomonadota bacterium]
MKSTALATLIALTASSASALSCNFGNVQSAWHEVEAHGLPTQLVQGTFDMREAWRLFEEEDYALRGQFRGVAIASDGSTQPLQLDVLIQGACINGDCGYLRPGEEVLTFLVNDPAVTFPVSHSWPCSSYPMAPTQENRDAMLTCMTAGPCEAEFRN